MNLALAKPVRQFAALALLLCVLAGSWLAIAAPIADKIASLRSEIAEKRSVLGRLQDEHRIVEEARELAARASAIDFSKLLLAGDSEALKAASLQSALAAIAAENGLRFRSTRTLPAREEASVRFVGVEASFEASLADVQKMLIAISAYRPMLSVTGLRMALAPAATLEPETAGNLLDVSIEVLGPAAVVGAAAAKG